MRRVMLLVLVLAGCGNGDLAPRSDAVTGDGGAEAGAAEPMCRDKYSAPIGQNHPCDPSTQTSVYTHGDGGAITGGTNDWYSLCEIDVPLVVPCVMSRSVLMNDSGQTWVTVKHCAAACIPAP